MWKPRTFSSTAICPRSPRCSVSRRCSRKNENLHRGHEVPTSRAFPRQAHPMAILSAMINASAVSPGANAAAHARGSSDEQAARLISQVRTIAAFSYRQVRAGLPIIYPKPSYQIHGELLHMLFSRTSYELRPEVVRALDTNFSFCTPTTSRIFHLDRCAYCLGAQANLFASAAAGVCALWDRCTWPISGVIEMLAESTGRGRRTVGDSSRQPRTRTRQAGPWAVGTGVYRNLRPARPRIIKDTAIPPSQGVELLGPRWLDIAHRMEEAALSDPYFVRAQALPQRGFLQPAYPCVRCASPPRCSPSFFSPSSHGRLIANFKEILDDPKGASTGRARSTVGSDADELCAHGMPRE